MPDPGVAIDPQTGIPRITIYPPSSGGQVGGGAGGAPLEVYTDEQTAKAADSTAPAAAAPAANGQPLEVYSDEQTASAARAASAPAAPPPAAPGSAAQPAAPSPDEPWWAPWSRGARRVAADVQNQFQAAGQGTTPIMSAQQPFEIGPAMQNDAGEVGYKDANGQFVPTDVNKHVVLNNPDTGVPTVYLRTQGTDEGRASSAGHLIGGVVGTGDVVPARGATGAAGAAQSAAGAAERAGVDVPRAITNQSQVGQIVAGMPGGGPLREAIGESVEGLGEHVGDVARETGYPSVVGSGERFSDLTQQAIKPPEGSVPNSTLGRLVSGVKDAYGDVEAVVDPAATAPLSSTTAVVQDIATRHAAAGMGPSTAADLVTEGVTRPGGMTFAGIKDLRTSIGEKLDTGALPEGMSETELRAVYGALSEDLERAAKITGGRAGEVAFARANQLASWLAQWKEALRPILRAGSGEAVYDAIIRMASASPASADVRTLQLARKSVPAPVWADIAATAMSRLGLNAAGEWSPARFISDYGKLSEEGKALLWGAVGKRNLIAHLNDIAEVAERFKASGGLANVSRTAPHLTTSLAFFEALRGMVGGIMKGSIKEGLVEPVVAIGSVIGNNVMARVLARPTTAAALGRWSRVYERSLRAGAIAMPTFMRSSNELAREINANFGTNWTAMDIAKAVGKSATDHLF